VALCQDLGWDCIQGFRESRGRESSVSSPAPRERAHDAPLRFSAAPLQVDAPSRYLPRKQPNHRASVVPPNTPFRNAIFHLVEKPHRVAVPVTRKHGGVGRVDQAKRCENSQNLSPAKRAIEEQANAA